MVRRGSGGGAVCVGGGDGGGTLFITSKCNSAGRYGRQLALELGLV